MTKLNWPFVGSEAVANGQLKKYQLRAGYVAVFPDVYVPKCTELSPRTARDGGWLWSHRLGVIAGLTASALPGAKWVDDSEPSSWCGPTRVPLRADRRIS